MNDRPGTGRTVRFALATAAAMLLTAGALCVTSGSALAAQRLQMSFSDSWIATTPAGEDEFSGFHTLNPAMPPAPPIRMSAALGRHGSFTIPKEAFRYPALTAGIANATISAIRPIKGRYNPRTGGLVANLTIRIVESQPDFTCRVEPLDLHLKTAGSRTVSDQGTDVPLAGAPFANGTGALLGVWRGQMSEVMSQVPPPANPADDACRQMIPDPPLPQDISVLLWLGGTVTVARERVTVAAPHRRKIRAGGWTMVPVRVKNRGNHPFRGRLTIRSSNPAIRAPKSVRLRIRAHRTRRVRVLVRATSRARGRGRLVFRAGGKKAVTRVIVRN